MGRFCITSGVWRPSAHGKESGRRNHDAIPGGVLRHSANHGSSGELKRCPFLQGG